jgi:hypothetical protein
MLITLLILVYHMLQFIGSSLISDLIKMTKIMKNKDQLLVVVSLAHQIL